MMQARKSKDPTDTSPFYHPEDHYGSESSSGTSEPGERQKGTKHKSRIINLQGKHSLIYAQSFIVYVNLVIRKYLHISCKIIR